MLVIFSMSHMQGGESGALSQKIAQVLKNSGIDLFKIFGEHTVWAIRKMAHMTEYGILFFLWMLPLGKISKGKWLALSVSVIFAASDEIHQSFIPGRVASVFDVAFDSLGSGIALAISLFWSFIFERNRNSRM